LCDTLLLIPRMLFSADPKISPKPFGLLSAGTSYWNSREMRLGGDPSHGNQSHQPLYIGTVVSCSVRSAYMTRHGFLHRRDKSLPSDWFKGPENLLRNLHVGHCHDPCSARLRAGSTPRRWQRARPRLAPVLVGTYRTYIRVPTSDRHQLPQSNGKDTVTKTVRQYLGP
jgi:hypothetical protein